MGISVRAAVAGLMLLVVVLADGCGSGGSGGSGGSSSSKGSSTGAVATTVARQADVELTEGDACGDAYFWASTPAGDVAVEVTVEAFDRSTEEPTTIPVDVTSDDVVVRVLRGTNLPRNFCNDVLDTEAEPTSEQDATAGTGEIVLQARETDGNFGCAASDVEPNGTLHLAGLVAEDGTTFAPIDVETNSIGCYAG